MLLEAGYGNSDPHLRLAQLGDALMRDCRLICAIKLHTEAMTIEEAARFFEEHAYMAPIAAAHEARRGIYDPSYLTYTLGKMILLKLRANYQTAQGSQFKSAEGESGITRCDRVTHTI